jgi:hypothetical protein
MIGGVLDRGLPITRRGEQERRLPPKLRFADKEINEYDSLVDDSYSPEVRLTSPHKMLLTGVHLGG